MENLLRNGSFEADWGEEKSHQCLVFPVGGAAYEKIIGNIFTPPGWVTWFRHDPDALDQPEVRDAWATFDSRRVHSGNKAILLFTFWRKHDAGFLQQVQVTPGTHLRLTAWAHAWSNHLGTESGGHPDDPFWSDGAGKEKVAWLAGSQEITKDPQQDAKSNFTFVVGIDPTGGIDPLADTVVWSYGYHIYNGYKQQLSVEVIARADTVTVFLCSMTMWAFKHNDAYWDDACLEAMGEPGPEPPPPPPPTEKASKLGPHVLRVASDLGEYIQAKPAVIKLVGDWGLAPNIPQGVLVIGRKVCDYDAQSQRSKGLSPAGAAWQFIQDQLETYQSNPLIKYWEGHNEPVWNDEKGMDWYANFEVERMRLMADLGLKCVIGNFATGTPPLELWPAFLPALRAAFDYEAILGLHEYSCPWMWWMTGNYQVDPAADEGDEGWTTLRYRKVYRQYLETAGLGHLPLVITECGIDSLVKPSPPDVNTEGWGAWRSMGGFWTQHDNEPDAFDYYFRQLTWYDQELQKDAYVIGATVFTWGNFGGTWKDFDVAGTPVAKKLIAYTQENPARAFEYPSGEQPEPPPPVPPGRGRPREQYERTYVLMPPGAGAEWVKAVADAAWDEHRYTIGGSADDAGIGDLDFRRVLAVNPGNWADNLKAFFETHYPGIEYVSIEAATPEELVLVLGGAVPTPQPEPPVWPLLLGLHDEAGGDWMRSVGMKGCCLVHHIVQQEPVRLDYTRLQNAGIRVIARLNWGYAHDGTGSIPPPAHKETWADAMAATISNSLGVWGWVIGNEVNNPSEWPGGWPSPSHVVTPGYYVELYNAIWERLRAVALIAPASLDPYNIVAGKFGAPMDPAEWAAYIYEHIVGLGFVSLHAKTQNNDPAECWSSATFTNSPLVGRYLHLRTVEDQLSWLPKKYVDKSIYVTELNPQRRNDGKFGWEAGNTEWVREAVGYLQALDCISGATFYRYEEAGDQALFGLCNQSTILAEIKSLAK